MRSTSTIRFLSAALVLVLLALGRIAAADSFHFAVTADMREFHTAFGTTLQGINDTVSGPGEFHISVGDIVLLQSEMEILVRSG